MEADLFAGDMKERSLAFCAAAQLLGGNRDETDITDQHRFDLGLTLKIGCLTNVK
jgi:hypothetical protein